MSFLQVSGVSRQVAGTNQITHISFTQHEFQKIAIAGATGSGKTTLLKIIAGLEQPDKGEVLLEGVRVKGPYETLLPGHPQIAYLSQYFELRHHYRVEEILEKANLMPQHEADNIYSLCRIDHLLKRYSHQLSGGESQRIALARLLVTSPRLLVLDEPYSNLDAIHTSLLKSVVHDIGEQLHLTCLMVSHEPADVLPWADEIIVLQNGQIVQKDTPFNLYHHPAQEHVAALFGKFNLVTPELAAGFEANGISIPKSKNFIRPEQFTIVPDSQSGVKGRLNKVLFMGSHYELEIHVGNHNIIMYSQEGNFQKNEELYLALHEKAF